jgi:YHS domain-containing protein
MKLFISALLVTGFVLFGCGEQTEKDSNQAKRKIESSKSNSHETSMADSVLMKSPELKQDETKASALVCVVSGEETDPNIFTEYNGRKYYFCCEKCQKLFNKNPQKYISKN